ncbi:AfsR/SARP family transcriptional regulator [Amycolatopsis antarctica]|uniref:AfsR/SARP family transcriptional regulator n=1 Tax=Amycolatopsis antarctica TaxID=1854586 RepID=UPI0013FDC5D0|nr:BTAD domain-containing putative transcriptional regulator [Amycolatopsis antarctica]
MTRYGLLGPLTVDGSSVSPGQQRTVLAALLVQANQPVTTSSLVDELWPEGAPDSANVIVQMCVSGLRKLLAPGVPARDARQVLRTSGGSYTLGVAEDELDQAIFLRHADEGVRLAEAGRAEAAAEALRAALSGWRGPALADVTGGRIVSAHAAWLDERRAATLERRIQAELELGRHTEVVTELRGRVEAEPTQEVFAAQLVTALAAAGRRGEAAEVFETARRALAEELGVRPGGRLLDAVRRIDAPERAAATVPVAQLPPHIADFTGRQEVLDRIAVTLGSGEGSGAPRVLALCGPGGIGKSALAVRAAHDLRESFPDAQVAADLRGGSGRPADVLGHFLRALGVSGAELPSGLTERQNLWRGRTAGARVLVLLDDARDEQQVRALLPGGDGCAVLVTTRRRLLGLEGASTITVPELTERDALDLLGALAGTGRVAAEPEQARRLLRLCGGLPLAVRIVGAKLAAREHEPIGELADRVADRHGTLGELRAGDLDVRATVEVSYAECTAAQQRALRLMGALPLPTFTRWTMATLLDQDRRGAAETVEELVEAQLVQVVGRDPIGGLRYRLHDLISAFAAEKGLSDPVAADEAADRVVRGYLALALRAHDALRAGRFPPSAPPEPARSDTARAVRDDPGPWRTEETPNLVAATRWAYDRGWWGRVAELAGAFAGLAERRPADTGARDVAVLGLLAARRAGDARAEAVSLCSLGDLRWESGLAGSAHRYYSLAVAVFDALGDDCGLARVLTAQADVDIEGGRVDQARAGLQRALLLAKVVGDEQCQADALDQLGSLLFDLGDYPAAEECFVSCRAIAESLGLWRSVAHADKRLADVLRWTGECERAGALLASSLRIAREHADRHWEGHVLRSLGQLQRVTGELDAAEESLGTALELFTGLRHRHARCYVLHSLGELYATRGDTARAELGFAACREMFGELNDWRGQGYTLLSLGTLWAARGDHDAATGLLHGALGIFERLGYRRLQEVTVAALHDIASAGNAS